MVFRLIIVLLFFSVGVFSQEKYTKHTISKGDNLTTIAKKYGVKTKDILEANPTAPKILKLNSVLLIPTKNLTPALKSNEIISAVSPSTHEVKEKETLWGISKKYNVSVDDLKMANPQIETEGLKMGQQINIPSKSVAITEKPIEEKVSTDVELAVEVLPKETKYAIAKKYGITVAELERQNPFIKGKLPVGYVLKIKTSKEKADAFKLLESSLVKKDTLSAPVQIADKTEIKDNLEVKKDTASLIKVTNHSDLVNLLILNATANIGTRYRSGGTTKAGFDCSGLMICTFSNFDIKLPRSSIEQSRIGMKVGSDNAQKGDLIFFKTNGRRHINHVGMVVEVLDGEIKFVHSSTHGGVMISSTKEPYYERSFTQVNRILE
jgi:cell wall-associated NlpC family hydrolase